MILNKRVITMLGAKMAPAPWVEAKNPPLFVIRTQNTRSASGAGSRSFGLTKRRFSRLEGWIFSLNRLNLISVNRP